eukprot:COSAG03_NODE_7048_length_970_cov_27.625718_2_plen_65_part_00
MSRKPKASDEDIALAVADCTKATTVHPDYSKAHYRLAVGLQKQGKFEVRLTRTFSFATHFLIQI